MSEKNTDEMAGDSAAAGGELATSEKAPPPSNTSRQRSVGALDERKMQVVKQRTVGEAMVVVIGMLLMGALAKEKLIEGYMAAAVIAILAGVKLSDVMQSSKKQ